MYNTKLHFHFTGIGGSGMSGIAEVLLTLGYRVSGTDQRQSSVLDRLASLGATIAVGHSREHLAKDASILVYSSAVTQSNPELVEARARGIPVIRRAEVLAELIRLKYGVVVAGAHGKTTTTAMIGRILEEGGKDPTVILGGTLRSSGGGGVLGRGDFLVAESDESDRCFLLLSPAIAVVTNIDAEHLSAYGSMEELERSFSQFLHAVPFYGLAITCADDPRVASLAASLERRVVTYGLESPATITAHDIKLEPGSSSYVVVKDNQEIGTVSLGMSGRHMVLNSLAAIAVGLEVGIPMETITRALRQMPGIARRMELLRDHQDLLVMSDYGHHPTELRATIRAVRDAWSSRFKRLVVVFQPHRYSRTKDCFEQFRDVFGDADIVLITEIYSAGEAPIPGISGETLCESLQHAGREFVGGVDGLSQRLKSVTLPGDLVLFLGAGSIGSIAEEYASCL
jgi:UDP-N-acetylmuramate--alanine ligase